MMPTMTIPEDKIMAYLDLLLTSSEPGASLHHLHVITARADAVGPLGLPDPEHFDFTIYAIANADPNVDAETFVAQVVMAAAVEAFDQNRMVLWAGLSQEAWVAPLDERARQLRREGRSCREHPDAAEATMIYAASRDGRRWRGTRWLTGPRAGTTEDVNLLVGQPDVDEGRGILCAGLIRDLVGATR